MASLIEIPTMNCCSFCNAPGHRIDKCTHPSIETIDQKILKAVAFSTIFTFLGSKYIEHVLSRCLYVELKALRYKFNVSENAKKLIKTRKGLLEYLVTGYKNMGIMNLECIHPWIEAIERGLAFIPEQPNLLPSEELNTFAYTINELFPNNPGYFVEIFRWYTQRLRQFNIDKNNYLLLLQPRKFAINALVSPVDNSDQKFECPICYQDEIEAVCSAKMTCGHIYCTDCMENYLKSKSKEKTLVVVLCCGICRGSIEDIHFKDIEKRETISKKYINV